MTKQEIEELYNKAISDFEPYRTRSNDNDKRNSAIGKVRRKALGNPAFTELATK